MFLAYIGMYVVVYKVYHLEGNHAIDVMRYCTS